MAKKPSLGALMGATLAGVVGAGIGYFLARGMLGFPRVSAWLVESPSVSWRPPRRPRENWNSPRGWATERFRFVALFVEPADSALFSCSEADTDVRVVAKL